MPLPSSLLAAAANISHIYAGLPSWQNIFLAGACGRAWARGEERGASTPSPPPYRAGFRFLAGVLKVWGGVCALCCCNPVPLIVAALKLPYLAADWGYAALMFLIFCLCRRTSIWLGGSGPGSEVEFPPIDNPTVMLQARQRRKGGGQGGGA